jgi:putative Ca2+/H+ antiporter (TMEM165/GDT1 family)
MLAAFLATYAAVFIAEIVGDKLLYTTGVLATRYRSGPVMAGMAAAFMVKMAAAVLLGEAIARLPKPAVALLTAAGFIAVAVILWRKPVEAPAAAPAAAASGVARGALVTFMTIVLSEWADVGMITAATMAARNPGVLPMVWLGAVAAMVTKGVLAAFLGAGVRRWIRDRIAPRTIRIVSVVAMIGLGMAAVAEDLGWIDDDEHGG